MYIGLARDDIVVPRRGFSLGELSHKQLQAGPVHEPMSWEVSGGWLITIDYPYLTHRSPSGLTMFKVVSIVFTQTLTEVSEKLQRSVPVLLLFYSHMAVLRHFTTTGANTSGDRVSQLIFTSKTNVPLLHQLQDLKRAGSLVEKSVIYA